MPTLIICLLSLLILLFSYSVKSFSLSVSFVSSRPAKSWLVNSLGPSSAPRPSPSDQGPSMTPRPRNHHHQIGRPHVVAPSPSESQDCEQTCMEPLTASPFLPPCGCVFPMKVRLILDVALYAVFPVMNELEIEVASGTYMKQSQVKIMGASADSQNQGRTVVDINLVPLGEKFDNTTAFLTYERFWQQKVPLNRSLFGDYAVMYISYTGIPSPPPFGNDTGSDPSGNVGRLPFTAIFINKNLKMKLRTIIITALSTIVLLLVLVGAFFILLKWRKIRRSSKAVGPAFKTSINKRSDG